MYTDRTNYFTKPQMECNKWQSQYINCDSNLAETFATVFSNDQKSHEESSACILATALTFGSAVAQKNYQSDLSADNSSIVDFLNSDSKIYSSLMWKNTQKENFCAEAEDSVLPLPLENQNTIVPATYNNPVHINDNYQGLEWNVERPNSFRSSPSSFYQQQSSNVVPYDYRYQQSIPINYNQVAGARINKYPLAVPVQTQYNSMAYYFKNFKGKYKKGDRKRFYAYKNIFGQERRSRQTYTTEQTDLLEQAFRVNQYASKDVRNMLAARTKLNIKQIKIWFQNRRMKRKKHISAESNTNHISSTVSDAQVKRSTLSNEEGQLQLQPTVQHHGYQNYSFDHQQYQQNLINQDPYTPNYENMFNEMVNQPYSPLGY